MECLDLCIKINPNYGVGHCSKGISISYILAWILRDSGQYKEAIECLDLCIKINPNFGDAYYSKCISIEYKIAEMLRD